MSSILDALKKLEAEKQAEKTRAAFRWPRRASDTPPHEPGPVVRMPGHERFTIRVTPTAIIVGAIVFGIFQVAASVAASILVARSNAGWAPVVRGIVQEAARTPVLDAPPPTPAQAPAPKAETPPQKAEGETPKPAPAKPKPKRAPLPKPETAQSVPLPNIDLMPDSPAKKGTALPNPGPPRSGPGATTPNPVPPLRKTVAAQPLEPPKKIEGPVDVSTLRIMSEADQLRLHLPKIKVNMTRPVTKDRPIPLAIINLQPVQVGEKIPNTQAILIGVDSRGIGIEIAGTGERFQIWY